MPKALISVYNKNEIKRFAKELINLGWEIISTGGTFKVLHEAGIQVTAIDDITDFPEIMDGRIKTLHPKIHAGILADRNNPKHLRQAKENNIDMIDLVVVNLYPFEDVIQQKETTEGIATEFIDIGGPTMLRAAAKNYKQVIVITDPNDYQTVINDLKSGDVSDSLRREFMLKVFEHTAEYDGAIARYFGGQDLSLNFKKLFDLRYGENPHQKAAFYRDSEIKETSIASTEVLHGKQLSYNNIMDADAALNLIKEFDRPAAAIIKHTNPCGCAVASSIDEAFTKAFNADPLSAFGGIVILNRNCTKEIAEAVNKSFTEIVLAPDFESDALKILLQKKNIRLLKVGEITSVEGQKDYRKVVGGMLEQDLDKRKISEKEIKIVSQAKPSKQEMNDMLFVWKVAKYVKSNSIVLVKDGVTVGVGAGQMSRVDSVDIAIKKAGDESKGCVAASDAFFPFRDSVDKLAQAGVKAIIQPGGSRKDDEVIAAADEHGISMVFTGVRAFKH